MRHLGASPAPALLDEWWVGVVKLAESLLEIGAMDGPDIYAIINPFILVL